MLSHHKFQRIAVSEMCLKTPGPLLIDDCQAWPRVGVKEEDKEHRVGRKGEQATDSGGGALSRASGLTSILAGWPRFETG